MTDVNYKLDNVAGGTGSGGKLDYCDECKNLEHLTCVADGIFCGSKWLCLSCSLKSKNINFSKF